LTAARAAAAEPAAFQPLPDLSGGTSRGSGYGISADGTTVVGEGYDASGQRAVRWTQAGAAEAIASPFSYAWQCSGDGSVVVGTFEQPPRAYRWTASTGAVLLGDLPGGIEWSAALGVSNDGAVVVGKSNSMPGYEAFRWTAAGGMQGLGDLPGGAFGSEARGISGDGLVVVGTGAAANGGEAFRWTASGGMVGLGELPGGAFDSEAYDASEDGTVVVGRSSSAASGAQYEPMRWTEAGGMVGLGDLPGGATNGYALGVSADGNLVVGFSETGLGPEAFVWDTAGGMRNLRVVLAQNGIDMTGWTLRIAYDVSADGTRIAGWGVNPSGEEQAWVAVLPEPNVTLGAAGALIALRRRRVPTKA
jgi:probable HAF family extracellular repeat protein